jgi:flagellar motility protein MotE (MotC chaperone)
MRVSVTLIALTAILLALPVHVELVVQQSQAIAKAGTVPGFGDHPRPWAENLAAAEEVAPVVAVAVSDEEKVATPTTCPMTASASEDRLVQLKAAELRINQQVDHLAALKAGLETLLERRKAAEDQDIQRLVNLYRNMKAGEAASILADLDMPIVVSIVMTMNERDAAPILAQMPKAAAQQITREIARQRSLVHLGGEFG